MTDLMVVVGLVVLVVVVVGGEGTAAPRGWEGAMMGLDEWVGLIGLMDWWTDWIGPE